MAFKQVLILTTYFVASRCRECSMGTYFDPVTGRCDPCIIICFQATVQGTVDQCQEKCPNYTDLNTPFRGTHDVEKHVTLGCDEQNCAIVLMGSLIVIESLIIVIQFCYKRFTQNHDGKEPSSMCCRKKPYPDLVLQTKAVLLQI